MCRHLFHIALAVAALALWSVGASAQVNVWEGTGRRARAKLTPYPAVRLCGVDRDSSLAEAAFPEDGSSRAATVPDSTAIIVCPGGSYFWVDKRAEGRKAGEWLRESGVSGFVLQYRTAGWFAYAFGCRCVCRGRRYPDPQDDLRQAMVYLREHSAELGIRADRVGVMGFSAGGHLALSSAEMFDPADRPAFVAAVYPVVSFSADCAHRRSRRGLLGDNRRNDRVMRDSLSLETHVPKDCPPVFLVNCSDDRVVDPENSALLDSALTAAGAPHKYIRYETGGHGFGADPDKGSEESAAWMDEFLEWLGELNLQ